MIEESTIQILTLSVYLSVIVPAVFILVAKFVFKSSLKVILIGMLSFFFVSQIILGLIHSIFLGNEQLSEVMRQPFIYIPYMTITTGLVTELGRYAIFAYLLKKYRDWKDGLGFGIGYGGFESTLVMGFTSLSMVSAATLINEGEFMDQVIVDQLQSFTASYAVLGFIERILLLIIHMALSILVLYAVKSGKIKYLGYSILAHAITIIPAALYQVGALTNIYLVNLIIAVLAAMSILFMVKSRALFNKE
ncbi:hypothetical protein BTS2_4103 [Bacillus sp. TS-2]|nr:hypothetical protein BTS2_4103 [Bacillus sp. TS-2]